MGKVRIGLAPARGQPELLKRVGLSAGAHVLATDQRVIDVKPSSPPQDKTKQRSVRSSACGVTAFVVHRDINIVRDRALSLLLADPTPAFELQLAAAWELGKEVCARPKLRGWLAKHTAFGEALHL
jgi:hypothetical protein